MGKEAPPLMKRAWPISIMAISVAIFLTYVAFGWNAYLLQPSAQSVQTKPTVVSEDPYVLAVGDVASCASPHDETTAALAAQHPGTIALLGDVVYDRGTTKEFAECFEPSWGKLKDRIRPAVGNHEYGTGNAEPYFAYFGDRAGEAGKGYYSYDIGTWHLIALNSNCEAGACRADSDQMRWLAKDLSQHDNRCMLAYFHHPRWSSGLHGSDKNMQLLWETLADAKVDVILNGHDHSYERFGRLDRLGQTTLVGPRQFVVGTGGRNLYAFRRIETGSEIRNQSKYGLLQMQLHVDGYSWKFLAVDGSEVDAGHDQCH